MTTPSAPQPAPQPAQPYDPRPASGPNGFGIAAIALGVVALGIAVIPFFGLIGVLFGLAGVALGIVGLALQKYRGRRVLAIVGTIVAGIATIAALILPWFTGLIWFLGWADEQGVLDRLSTYSTDPWSPRDTDRFAPEPTATPERTAPELTNPGAPTVDPGAPGPEGPVESTPPVPTTTE